MSELKYWVWLSELFSRGSDKPNALLDLFETPEQIFAASAEALSANGVLNAAETARVTRHSLERSEFILRECERLRIKVIPQESAAYPERLKHIYGAPAVLYCYGDLSGLDEAATLGVVGTRRPSQYGQTVTDELCYQLASAGMVIVSGCAVGIDAYAHMGTLKANGRTIAVLGCGLDVDYPSENNGLKREILRHGGALVSELPPGTGVTGKYFPTRNRLISGLSGGVLVTEAPMRSGSLITLNLALEQGRDVFCVPPHDIHDPMFRGVIKPLREGAIPVYEANDILLEYYGEYSHKLSADKAVIDFVRLANEEPPLRRVADGTTAAVRKESVKPAETEKTQTKEKLPEPELTGDEKTVYDALTAEPQYANDLARITGLGLSALLSALTELELEGLVTSYSGQRYSKLGAPQN